jgi:predicted N-acetyltransferase YhbS
MKLKGNFLPISNPKIKTLQECPHLWQATLDLVSHAFDYSAHLKIEDDFAPLFNQQNLEHLYILTDEKTVFGHVGISLRELQFKNHTLPIAMIGGVAISHHLQKQGLFSKLIDFVLNKYHSQVGLFFLWSDLYDLYQKKDFYLAGSLEEVVLNTPFVLPGKNLFQLTMAEWDTIKNHYLHFSKDFLSLKRQDFHWSIYPKMKNVFVDLKSDSYSFIGKGADLENIIHEIAFTHQQQFEKELKGEMIWLPSGSTLFKSQQKLKYLALMRLADKNILNQFFDGIFEKKLFINGLKDQVVFTFENKEFTVAKADFLTYLFGPNPLDEFKDYLPGLYIPGIDSI